MSNIKQINLHINKAESIGLYLSPMGEYNIKVSKGDKVIGEPYYKDIQSWLNGYIAAINN